MIYLYETTALLADGTERAVRFCTGPGYAPDEPGYFLGRIIEGSDGISARQSIFSDRRSFGFGGRDVDMIEAANNDGELDDLTGLGFGRPATVKLVEQDAPYETAVAVLRGVATNIMPGTDTLRIGWRERAEELNRPLQQSTFLGSNSGVNGLEGTPADIGGQRKPYAGGRHRNIAPVLLNTSRRIMGWRFSETGARLPTHQILDFRVNGNSNWLSVGDYPNAAALTAASPEEGEYATCLAESLVMVGDDFNLSGTVGIDVLIEPLATSRYAGAQIRALLNRAGVADERINLAELEAIDTARPYEVSVWVQDENSRDILDRLMASVLACAWVDENDNYRFLTLAPLTNQTPVASFQSGAIDQALSDMDADIKAISGVFSGAGDNDVPIYRVQVNYARNGLVLSPDQIAAAVPAAEAATLSQAMRVTAPATNPDTLVQFPNAGTLTHDTLLVNQAAAEEVRDALLALLSQARLTLQLSAQLTPALAGVLALGAVVSVNHKRFGLSAGRLGQVLALRIQTKTQTATLDLWMAHG